jgi:hypothetical protein
VKVIVFERAYGIRVLAMDLNPLLVYSIFSKTSVRTPVLDCLDAL